MANNPDPQELAELETKKTEAVTAPERQLTDPRLEEVRESFERLLAKAGEPAAMAHVERKELSALVSDIVNEGMTDERRKSLEHILSEGKVPSREATALVKDLEAVTKGEQPVNQLLTGIEALLDTMEEKVRAGIDDIIKRPLPEAPATPLQKHSAPPATTTEVAEPDATQAGGSATPTSPAPAIKLPMNDSSNIFAAAAAFVVSAFIAIASYFGIVDDKHADDHTHKDNSAEKTSRSGGTTGGTAPAASADKAPAASASAAPTSPRAASDIVLRPQDFGKQPDTVVSSPVADKHAVARARAEAHAVADTPEKISGKLATRVKKELQTGTSGFAGGVYEGLVGPLDTLREGANLEQLKVLDDTINQLKEAGKKAAAEGRHVTDKELDMIDLGMQKAYDEAAAQPGHAGKVEAGRGGPAIER